MRMTTWAPPCATACATAFAAASAAAHVTACTVVCAMPCTKAYKCGIETKPNGHVQGYLWDHAKRTAPNLAELDSAGTAYGPWVMTRDRYGLYDLYVGLVAIGPITNVCANVCIYPYTCLYTY